MTGDGEERTACVSGGRNTVGAWVLLAIAIVGWLGVRMEVAGRQHVGQSKEGLAN